MPRSAARRCWPRRPRRRRRRSSRRDEAILNYALTLEYVQDSFYSEVERIGALSGGLAEQAKVVAAHERAHVKAFREVLGSRAVKRPRFDFRGATEDPSASARPRSPSRTSRSPPTRRQAPLIQNRGYLVPALAIHSVEARHAAWIRRLAGDGPAADAFDEPRSKRSTLAIVADTHFVAQDPQSPQAQVHGVSARRAAASAAWPRRRRARRAGVRAA